MHEVAQSAAPGAHVVYVDNDPVVLAHGLHLLHGVAGATITEHDLRQPEDILADPELRALVDFGAASRTAARRHPALHLRRRRPERDHKEASRAVPVREAHLVHGTADGAPEVNEAAEVYDQATLSAHVRSRNHILRLIEGLDLEEPGIVWLPERRPHPGREPPPNPAEAYSYALVARKP